jgi:hypothetical protein
MAALRRAVLCQKAPNRLIGVDIMAGFSDFPLRRILLATWPTVPGAFQTIEQYLCTLLTISVCIHIHFGTAFSRAATLDRFGFSEQRFILAHIFALSPHGNG